MTSQNAYDRFLLLELFSLGLSSLWLFVMLLWSTFSSSNSTVRLFAGTQSVWVTECQSLPYDTIEEFNVDSKAEYTA